MRKNNVVFYAVTMLFWFSLYAYQSNFAPYLDALNATGTMIGLVMGSYGFVQFLARIPIGVFSDKRGTHKPFIITGILFTVISAAVLYYSENMHLILLGRVCAGFAASTWVNFTVLYSSYFKREDAVSAIGTLTFFNNMGQLLAMLLGAALVQWTTVSISAGQAGHTGYKSAFLLALGAGICALIISFYIREERIGYPPAKGISVRDIVSVMSDRILLFVSLIAALSQFITFSTTFSFTTAYASSVLHSTPAQNGWLVVIPYIPTALGALFLGKTLAKRYSAHTLIGIGLVLVGVFTMITPMVTRFEILVILQVFAGVGRGISFPLLMGLSIKNIPPEKRGIAMGFFQSVYALGMFMGPFFLGVFSDRVSLDIGFVIIGGVSVLTALFAYHIVKRLV
jgi:MFS family permease